MQSHRSQEAALRLVYSFASGMGGGEAGSATAQATGEVGPLVFPTVLWMGRHLFSPLVSVVRLRSNALQVIHSHVAATRVPSFVGLGPPLGWAYTRH